MDYSKLQEEYGKEISKEQLIKILKISKEHARYLLENGLIPCIKSDHNISHKYRIKLSDVIAYMENDKPPIPVGIKKRPCKAIYEDSAVMRYRLKQFFASRLEKYEADVLTLNELSAEIGLSTTWICTCVEKGTLKALHSGKKLFFPKKFILDFVVSEIYTRMRRSNPVYERVFLDFHMHLNGLQGITKNNKDKENKYMEAKIIAISMEKGGVGKTTTSFNLAAALANSGYKVLLADLDPQGDLCKLLRKTSEIKNTVGNIILSVLDGRTNLHLEDAYIHILPNLQLLPTNRQLAAIQNRLISEQAMQAGIFAVDDKIHSEAVLKHVLDRLRHQFDYIIIDCPPSLSMITINALVAADSVILPVEAQVLSFEDTLETFETVKRIQQRYNPDLEIEGILITKCQEYTNLGRGIKKLVHETYGEDTRIFKRPIPYEIKVAEQPLHGVSIFDLAPDSHAADAYMKAARELISYGEVRHEQSITG